MAIARNGTADLLNNGSAASPYTKAYTVNAASNYLIVSFLGDLGSGNNDITGVTYASAPMTRIGAFTTGWANGANDRFLYVYGLASPTTGSSQNVVISYTNTHYIIAIAADYGGVDIRSPFGTVATASTPYTSGGGATSLTTNVAVTVPGSWVICIQGIDQNLSAGTSFGSTNLTQEIQGAAFAEPTLWDSNGIIAPGTFGAVIQDTTGQINGTNFDIYTVGFALQPPGFVPPKRLARTYYLPVILSR